VNETKTKLREARTERFDFLGYTFGPYWDRRTGKRYLGAGPSAKSRQRLKVKVHDLTKPGNLLPWDEVRDQLNAMLRGWQAYFGYGTLKRAYSEVDWYVANRVRHFLRRPAQGPVARITAVLDRVRLGRPRGAPAGSAAATGRHAACLRVKPAGEPDVGNRQVRFDERGEETECCLHGPSYRASLRLYPTPAKAWRRPGEDPTQRRRLAEP
jgi:hypothetical protein